METTQKIGWYRKVTILLAITTIIPTSLLMMGLVSPPAEPAEPASAANTPVIITQETANTYVANYLATATTTNSVVRAVIIESGALTSMNNIAKQYPGTTSYRVYFAKDNAGAQVSVVVGLTAAGLDMTLPVYCSTRQGNNLCPPMCDAAGAIDPSNF